MNRLMCLLTGGHKFKQGSTLAHCDDKIKMCTMYVFKYCPNCGAKIKAGD